MADPEATAGDVEANCLTPPAVEQRRRQLDAIPIYYEVLKVRSLIIKQVDISLKYDQLRSPQIHSFLVKPITSELKTKEYLGLGLIYSLLANVHQFKKEMSLNPVMEGVMNTRAMICEFLAVRMMKEYSYDDLVDALTYDFYPLAKGSEETPKFIYRWQRVSALEVAIKAEAKHLLANAVVVQILQEIWNGSIMFQSSLDKLHRLDFDSLPAPGGPGTSRDSLVVLSVGSRGPGVTYRYEDASIFKLSRLRVPKYRHVINTLSFLIMIVLYLLVLSRKSQKLTILEVFFWAWSLGFIVDEIVGFSDAGFTLYVISLWNLFDLVILMLLLLYAAIRVTSLFIYYDDPSGGSAGRFLVRMLFVVYRWPNSAPESPAEPTDPQDGTPGTPDVIKSVNALAYDILATVSIFLFPRLFSVFDHYPYIAQLLIAFRQMSIDLFALLGVIAVFASGFWVAFTMSFARKIFSAQQVAYDMLRILFGFTPAVWENWEMYSPLGKIILLLYLFITQFLIVTILIAVLSNSFARIAANSNEEFRYLVAVNTVTMIKSESSSLFAYYAPWNIIEYLVRPLYYVLPMRQFLVLNRTIIKATHFPFLLGIFIHERLYLRHLRACNTDTLASRNYHMRVRGSESRHFGSKPSQRRIVGQLRGLKNRKKATSDTHVSTTTCEAPKDSTVSFSLSSGSASGTSLASDTHRRTERTPLKSQLVPETFSNPHAPSPSSSMPRPSNFDLLDSVFTHGASPEKRRNFTASELRTNWKPMSEIAEEPRAPITTAYGSVESTERPPVFKDGYSMQGTGRHPRRRSDPEIVAGHGSHTALLEGSQTPEEQVGKPPGNIQLRRQQSFMEGSSRPRTPSSSQRRTVDSSVQLGDGYDTVQSLEFSDPIFDPLKRVLSSDTTRSRLTQLLGPVRQRRRSSLYRGGRGVGLEELLLLLDAGRPQTGDPEADTGRRSRPTTGPEDSRDPQANERSTSADEQDEDSDEDMEYEQVVEESMIRMLGRISKIENTLARVEGLLQEVADGKASSRDRWKY